MNDQTNYQPGKSGLNPTANFDAQQKAAAGAPQKEEVKNSTQEILQIAEIRDGVVIMNDGSFRLVVFCRAINFVLMSEQERTAVEYAYQGFLNSLFFPIQIVIRSRRVDATKYLERLDQTRQQQTNMLLGLVMDDYINFMADLIANTDIMDKFFYVVVPYSTDEADKANVVRSTQGFFGKLLKLGQTHTGPLVIEESTLNDAKRELRRRGQVVIEGLQQCGVLAVPLNTEELIELYYESYNPDGGGGHQLNSLKDLTAPYVTRGGEPQGPAQTAPPAPPTSMPPPSQAMAMPAPAANPMPAPQPQALPPPVVEAGAIPPAGPSPVVANPPQPPVIQAPQPIQPGWPVAAQWVGPNPPAINPQPIVNQPPNPNQ